MGGPQCAKWRVRMRTTSRRGRGCLSQTSLCTGAGRRLRRGGVCRPARTRLVWSRRVCVRACVFACGHSSRHQPLSPTRGSERPLFFVPGVPFLPYPRLLPLRADSVLPAGQCRAPDPKAQVRRARRRASQLSRFPQVPLPPPPPLAVRLLGVHSSGVRPAAAQLTPTPSTPPGPPRYSSWVFSQAFPLL